MMAEPGFAKKIGTLASDLGTTIVQALTGNKEKQRVLDLITGKAEPDAHEIERVDVTYGIYEELMVNEGLATTRAFFIAGTDTVDGFESNLSLIREGKYDAVRGSADALMTGGYT